VVVSARPRVRLDVDRPAHSLKAPALAAEIAALRVIPAVCGVFGPSSSAWTTRTP